MEVVTSPAEPTSTMVTQSPPPASNSTGSMQRPKASRSPHSNPNLSTLPPLITTASSILGARTSGLHKKSSYAKLRHLSSYSNASGSASFSRPESYVFPAFHSSLPYALVRDFAYPSSHPLHYGPPPMEDRSSASTPASEFNRRLSDPPRSVWPPTRAQWAATDPSGANISFDTGGGWEPRLPATAYGGGPPYKEDDDLLSPVVTSSRHKKSRSNIVDYDFARSIPGSGKRASQSYADARGGIKGGGAGAVHYHQASGQNVRHLSDHQQLKSWQQRQAEEDVQPPPLDTDLSKPFDRFDDETAWARQDAYGYSLDDQDESRYSRDYQFTIASPDEEMHGKAVALFDFERENDNELPLFEGQVIWVSYRHGQGWLVAQDPRSGESGLVPEEYVRLVRDIEGGIRGLNGLAAPGDEITDDIDTPTLDTLEPYKMSYNDGKGTTTQSHQRGESNSGKSTTGVAYSTGQEKEQGQGGYYLPVQSHFSTSSKDLEPYPQHQLLGSQVNTPIAANETQLPDESKKQLLLDDDDDAGANNSSRGVTRNSKKGNGSKNDANDDDDDDDDDDNEDDDRDNDEDEDEDENDKRVIFPNKAKVSAMSSVFGGQRSSTVKTAGKSENSREKSDSSSSSQVLPARSKSNASSRSSKATASLRTAPRKKR